MDSNVKDVIMSGSLELKNILLSAQSVNLLIGISLEKRNDCLIYLDLHYNVIWKNFDRKVKSGVSLSTERSDT